MIQDCWPRRKDPRDSNVAPEWRTCYLNDPAWTEGYLLTEGTRTTLLEDRNASPMLLAAASVRGNIVSSATLTLRTTFLPNMGLAKCSSSEESNLVKSASRSERISLGLRSRAGLLSRAGPGLVASPTHTPGNPYRELINSGMAKAEPVPVPKHRRFACSSIKLDMNERRRGFPIHGHIAVATRQHQMSSPLSDQTSDFGHQLGISELHRVATRATLGCLQRTLPAEPPVQLLDVCGHNGDALCRRWSMARPLSVLVGLARNASRSRPRASICCCNCVTEVVPSGLGCAASAGRRANRRSPSATSSSCTALCVRALSTTSWARRTRFLARSRNNLHASTRSDTLVLARAMRNAAWRP